MGVGGPDSRIVIIGIDGGVDKIKYQVLNNAQGGICITKEFLLKCWDVFSFERNLFRV